MKLLHTIFIIIVLTSCKAKYITDGIIDKKFENFDVKIFKGDKKEYNSKGKVLIYKWKDTYITFFHPKHDYYSLFKKFDNSGMLIEKGLFFGGEKIGIWRIYNKKGKIIKKVNYDNVLGLKFDYNNVIDYLHQRGKINKFKKDPSHEVLAGFDKEKKYWYVDVFYHKTEKQMTPFLHHEYILNVKGVAIKIKENIEVIEY